MFSKVHTQNYTASRLLFLKKTMARFRVKYYRADIDSCDFIIQKKCLFFWRCYDSLVYTKDEALKRLKEIEENYPDVRPADVLKEIEV